MNPLADHRPDRDTAITEFHVSNPGGWPKGSYQVEVFLNGSSVETESFKVGWLGARYDKEEVLKSLMKRDVASEESEPPVRWLLRGRTYVAITRGGAEHLDEDRSDSVVDEETPGPS